MTYSLLKSLALPMLVAGGMGSAHAAIITTEISGAFTAPVSQEVNIYYAAGQQINAHNAPFQEEFKNALAVNSSYSFTFQYDDSASPDDWYDVMLLSGNIGSSYTDFSAYEAKLILGADSFRFDLVQRVDYNRGRYQQNAIIFISDDLDNRADFRAEGSTAYGYGVFGARSDFDFTQVTPGATDPGDDTNLPPQAPTDVAEPSALGLLALGLAGFGLLNRRRRAS